MTITIRPGPLDLDACRAVYAACTLGGRRPIDDAPRFSAMFAQANVVLGAFDGDTLVGVARALTDTVYCTYLSDLAVAESHQRQGIGLALMHAVRAAAPRATLILLAAPQAVDYYPRVGFRKHDSAWTLGADEPLGSGGTSCS